jgi:hypothetical protein
MEPFSQNASFQLNYTTYLFLSKGYPFKTKNPIYKKAFFASDQAIYTSTDYGRPERK